jgi:hypothetical protein
LGIRSRGTKLGYCDLHLTHLFLTYKNSQMTFKHLLGFFLVAIAFSLAIYLVLHLYLKSFNPLFLLFLGLGAVISFFLGIFILPKSL